MIGAFGSATLAKEVDFISKCPEKCSEYSNKGVNDLVLTCGPISPYFDCYEIEFIDGDPAQIREIEYLLNTTFSLNKIGFNSFICTNLSFTVTFHRRNQNIRPHEIFPFFTTFVEKDRLLRSYIGNMCININHIVTVKGFNGDFIAVRGFFTILPGFFEFLGEFEEAIIIK